MISPKTVVIAGSGNIAHYLVEEFLQDGSYGVAVMARKHPNFFKKGGVELHQIQEYTLKEVLKVINAVRPFAIVSALSSKDPEVYTSIHESLLDACIGSATCKRLITSEYIGNIRDFESIPRIEFQARRRFREMLRAQSSVQWTSINQGWLADYFVQPADGSRSYIRPFPEGWPIDIEKKRARIIGSGEDLVTWTAARDMSKAVVKLMAHDNWPTHTYLYGETTTWNKAITKLEKFYGFSFERVARSKKDIEADLGQDEDSAKKYMANIDEFTISGAGEIPRDEAVRQRKKYFADVHFRTIDEVLQSSLDLDII